LTLRRKVSILGSTGSIGVSTLDLLAQAKAQGSADVQIIALTAGKNVEALIAQALAWRPVMAVIEDEAGF
jgi:1-deoxy-D-xylulose-5-phosphate reductoisomerase